jgi:hypothetical protein
MFCGVVAGTQVRRKPRGYSVLAALGVSHWSAASQFRCTTPSRKLRWVDGGFLGLYGVCTNRQLFGHFFILFVEFEIGFAPLKGLMSVASLSTETTPDAQKGSRRSGSEAKGL